MIQAAKKKSVCAPKGYIEKYNPQAKTTRLLAAVAAVLAEQADYLPLTLRQVYYALEARHVIKKTKQDYNRLGRAINHARRASWISWDAIRDDELHRKHDWGWSGPEEYWTNMRLGAERYHRDLVEAQDFILEVWCEAAGMVPQLARVTEPYTVPVMSTKGFDSVTAKHDLAMRIYESGKGRAVVLHLGDCDPSGESIFSTFAEDVRAFVAKDAPGIEVEFRRIALTGAQVLEYGLPTAPPKKGDSRSRRWAGETCELEALRPAQVAALLDEALQEYFDPAQLEADRAAGTAERDAILAELAKASR